MDALFGVFTAFGLSSSAGLNAYLPLLVVALLARFTHLVTLQPPWDAMTSGWVIGLLAVLLAIEMLVDKVPAVDTINDIIQTFIRPAAGAVLFAANGGVIGETHPVLALVAGLLIAGGVHAAKASARPVLTATTGGLLNPVVSTLEDVLALITAIVSIVAPLLGILIMVLVIVWLVRRLRHRREQTATRW